MTKSTQQLADELAGKLIALLVYPYPTLDKEKELISLLQKETSLLELFEVARAAEQKRKYTHDTLCQCNICITLTNLQKKVEL